MQGKPVIATIDLTTSRGADPVWVSRHFSRVIREEARELRTRRPRLFVWPDSIRVWHRGDGVYTLVWVEGPKDKNGFEMIVGGEPDQLMSIHVQRTLTSCTPLP